MYTKAGQMSHVLESGSHMTPREKKGTGAQVPMTPQLLNEGQDRARRAQSRGTPQNPSYLTYDVERKEGRDRIRRLLIRTGGPSSGSVYKKSGQIIN